MMRCPVWRFQHERGSLQLSYVGRLERSAFVLTTFGRELTFGPNALLSAQAAGELRSENPDLKLLVPR
jgi:hypothetical protein